MVIEIRYPEIDFEGVDLRSATDDCVIELTELIIEEAIIENGVYYDVDRIDKAVEELIRIIGEVVINPRSAHLRFDEKRFVEFVSYMAVKLG